MLQDNGCQFDRSFLAAFSKYFNAITERTNPILYSQSLKIGAVIMEWTLERREANQVCNLIDKAISFRTVAIGKGFTFQFKITLIGKSISISVRRTVF